MSKTKNICTFDALVEKTLILLEFSFVWDNK